MGFIKDKCIKVDVLNVRVSRYKTGALCHYCNDKENKIRGNDIVVMAYLDDKRGMYMKFHFECFLKIVDKAIERLNGMKIALQEEAENSMKQNKEFSTAKEERITLIK